MSSTLAVSLHDHDPNRHDTSNTLQPDGRRSVSPHALHHFETPGASSSALSCPSDYEEDPYFGAPSFLDDEQADWPVPVSYTNHTNGVDLHRHAADPTYPLTPEPTASIHTASPRSELRAAVKRPQPGQPPASISPQELQRPFVSNPVVTHNSQLTPSQSSSARTSEDGLAPAAFNMQARSPKVTVSVWDQDEKTPSHTVERSFEDPTPSFQGGYQSAGDLISSGDQHPTSAPRDANGRWQRDPATGHAGLGPRNRPSDEVTSINDLDSQRQNDERNEEVGRWLEGNLDELSTPAETRETDLRALEQAPADTDDNIPLGDTTENRFIPGQTYYDPNGGEMTDMDREIIASNRNWENAPMIHEIQPGFPGRHQPQTAQEAIARFERMYRDTDSILSRQATWGTRRRSFHSTADIDTEGVLSGNFLKKLSISKHTEKGTKAGNLLSDLRGLVQRRPSISSLRKRRNSNVSDEGQQEDGGVPLQKQESAPTPHLAPPDRTSSWGKSKKPSLNTALGNTGANAGAVGGRNHVRKTSVGAMSFTSPKGFMQSLKVENTLQRPRSRSEAPKPTTTTPDSSDSHPNLIGMLRANGGPPVPSISRPSMQVDMDDDDDDDDDLNEDNEMRANANLIDKITPNFAGFQEHVITLNPYMDGQHNYLVERIAHQQIVRYKNLLGLRVKHLQLGTNCPCGSLCIAMGGQANVLEQKGDGKDLGALAGHFPDEDDDGTPIDGAINQDNFPPDIPLPPTQHLPAEFECQLCFSRRKFVKPSDWTKHVHEDVQPFTCTWDRCRDAKSFKRKADWVRHENEGHRHLEWWTCDVEECRHTCYRRDNFLQHLVREHKFKEPKVKTKAAIKKAGGADPTWKKVEECHVATPARPQEEPCRFCGKTFPTWKKLTVHLAKHMEQISLPVLRLVAAKAKEIDADTIISPVQDLPPRQNFSVAMDQNQHIPTNFANDQHPMSNGIPYQDNPYGNMYPVMPSNDQSFGQQAYYPQQYENMGHTLQHNPMGVHNMGHDFGQAQMQDMSMSTAPYGHEANHYMSMPSDGTDGGLEPFPPLPEGLGLHNTVGGMGYNAMMDTGASASPYSGHGSASPYMHSPHQHPNGADPTWDNRQMPSFQ